MSEEAVVALRNEMEVLRQNLTSQTDYLRIAQSTIKELEEILADQNAKCAANFEEEKEELLAEIEALTHRLNDARDRITELDADIFPYLDQLIHHDIQIVYELAQENHSFREKAIFQLLM
jgi:chromosome segregation ATPase